MNASLSLSAAEMPNPIGLWSDAAANHQLRFGWILPRVNGPLLLSVAVLRSFAATRETGHLLPLRICAAREIARF